MKRNSSLWSVLALSILGGCASHPATTELPLPPRVPPAPVVQQVPIDPNLQDAAQAELITATNSSDPILRGNAIEGLQKSVGDKAEQPIIKALGDSDPGVRFAAALAAGRLKLASAYQPLLAMAYDKDLRVQVAVRFALHRLGDTRLSHDLEKMSTSFDPQVRACTAQVLGYLQEPTATRILKPMLNDKSLDVRLEANAALWKMGDADALNALLLDTVSAYPDDQIFALLALASHRDQSATHYIRGQMTNDYLEVSLAAAQAMGMLGYDDGWYVAVPAAKSTEARQRSMAALAMGAIGRPDLQKTLAPLLTDPDAGVRASAATAILELHASQPMVGSGEEMK